MGLSILIEVWRLKNEFCKKYNKERYCGNMIARSKIIIALLKNMYETCANSLSSDACKEKQSPIKKFI